MRIKKIIPVLLLVVSCLLLVDFLSWHWRLGMSRYFDVDEFAHLKWAYEIFSGKKPYVDFLSFFPPGFHWFLAPLFLFGKGTTPFTLGRLGEFGVFGGLVVATIGLFWQVRKNLWGALLAGALLAFLPLPFDKFLEIRPDTLATLFVVIGIIGQIRWKREGRKYDGFLAGLFYAFSLLVLPKMVPNVLVGVAISFMSARDVLTKRVGRPNTTFLQQSLALFKENTPFLLGFLVPLVLFGFWILTLGNLPVVLYSLTKLPVESNKISEIFFMVPDIFFYPNQIFYGMGGWNGGLITNHVLWIAGGLIGIYRLLTGGLPSFAKASEGQGEKGQFFWAEILIAGNFIVQLVFYVAIVPLKHSQYLIPIAFFVAWYVADGVFLFWKNISRIGQIGQIGFTGLFLVGAVFLYKTNIAVESPKLAWTNREDLDNLKKLYTTIPMSEYILDLDGRTLYYKDPYYACCIPFGQFAPYLSRPLPHLTEALEQTKTKYIWQGDLKRVDTLLPKDQTYVRVHFADSGIPGLLKRK